MQSNHFQAFPISWDYPFNINYHLIRKHVMKRGHFMLDVSWRWDVLYAETLCQAVFLWGDILLRDIWSRDILYINLQHIDLVFRLKLFVQQYCWYFKKEIPTLLCYARLRTPLPVSLCVADFNVLWRISSWMEIYDLWNPIAIDYIDIYGKYIYIAIDYVVHRIWFFLLHWYLVERGQILCLGFWLSLNYLQCTYVLYTALYT